MNTVRNGTAVDNEFVEFHTFCAQCGSPSLDSSQERKASNTSDNVHLLPTENDDEPKIILHRKGNTVEAIEFQCPCGKRTLVHLIYDGD